MTRGRRLARLERAVALAVARASATPASSSASSGVAFAFASRASTTSASRASTSAFASTSRARGFAASSAPRGVDGGETTGVSNADFAKYLTALVVAVVGATYASVPLYRMFC